LTSGSLRRGVRSATGRCSRQVGARVARVERRLSPEDVQQRAVAVSLRVALLDRVLDAERRQRPRAVQAAVDHFQIPRRGLGGGTPAEATRAFYTRRHAAGREGPAVAYTWAFTTQSTTRDLEMTLPRPARRGAAGAAQHPVPGPAGQLARKRLRHAAERPPGERRLRPEQPEHKPGRLHPPVADLTPFSTIPTSRSSSSAARPGGAGAARDLPVRRLLRLGNLHPRPASSTCRR